MASLLPGGAVGPDLGGLLHMEGLACFVALECRALLVHPEFCCPDRRSVRGGAPPNPLAQALRMGFQAPQLGRIWKHGSWIGLGEALTVQEVVHGRGMTTRHGGAVLTP